MTDIKQIQLRGRVIIKGFIRAKTGLHVGAGKGEVKIGGVDNSVMRDLLTNQPYIPGSSLRGKLRSLAEKSEISAKQNTKINKDVFIHTCGNPHCPVCSIYGAPGQSDTATPTRLVIRDCYMEPESVKRLDNANPDMPYTELKYESAIDRVTSQATPRVIERVPADTVFGPFEMIFSLYNDDDSVMLKKLFRAMSMLEDDYLGGGGGRGSGKIKFERLELYIKPVSIYENPAILSATGSAPDLDSLEKDLDSMILEINKKIPVEVE